MCQRTLLEKIYVGYRNLSFHGAAFKFKPVSSLTRRKEYSDKLIIHCTSWADSQFLQLKYRVLIKTRMTVNLLLSCTVNNQWIVI